MEKCLTACRGCCKFEEDDRYFAPKVTKEELEIIKSNKAYKKVFHSFKKSKNVFQISLIKSKFSKGVFVCPYLDEKTQKCIIYKIRPFDCEFWPFLFMHDQKGENVLIAHFDKDICKTTDAMSKAEFKKYLKKDIEKWINEKNIIGLTDKYPELIWDYEPDAFVIREIK